MKKIVCGVLALFYVIASLRFFTAGYVLSAVGLALIGVQVVLSFGFIKLPRFIVAETFGLIGVVLVTLDSIIRNAHIIRVLIDATWVLLPTGDIVMIIFGGLIATPFYISMLKRALRYKKYTK